MMQLASQSVQASVAQQLVSYGVQGSILAMSDALVSLQRVLKYNVRIQRMAMHMHQAETRAKNCPRLFRAKFKLSTRLHIPEAPSLETTGCEPCSAQMMNAAGTR